LNAPTKCVAPNLALQVKHSHHFNISWSNLLRSRTKPLEPANDAKRRFKFARSAISHSRSFHVAGAEPSASRSARSRRYHLPTGHRTFVSAGFRNGYDSVGSSSPTGGDGIDDSQAQSDACSRVASASPVVTCIFSRIACNRVLRCY
jgi:hypothetical protein